jgi:hypothetical protein
MTKEQISDLLMVGEFMEIENLFPYRRNNDEEPIGVYIAEDDRGTIDSEVGAVLYNPHTDWNVLMTVCKKIIEMYFSERQDIFTGLTKCDIDATYKACVVFIKFWNDDTQEKLTWTNKPNNRPVKK